MLISSNKWKWLRICLKKAYGEKLIYWKVHIGIGAYNIIAENKEENYLAIYIFHPKLPISIKIPVTLLQIVCICMTAISPKSSSWTTSLLTC